MGLLLFLVMFVKKVMVCVTFAGVFVLFYVYGVLFLLGLT